MPITFSQVVAAGDVMSADRHTLFFPTLPQGVRGDKLTIRHTEVSLPPWEVGQVVVKLFGWSVAFAGRRNQANTFTCSFLETVDAPVIKALYGWQAMAHGMRQAGGYTKAQYAVNCKLVAADTTGKYALTCNIHNVWPQSLQMGSFEETSNAWHHDCTFSMDAVDIVGLSTYERAHQSLKNLDFSSSVGDETSRTAALLGYNSGLYNTPGTMSAAFRQSLYATFFGGY